MLIRESLLTLCFANIGVAHRRHHATYLKTNFKGKTRRSVSVHCIACGTWYSKTEGTDLGGIELQCSSQFFQVGGHHFSEVEHLAISLSNHLSERKNPCHL